MVRYAMLALVAVIVSALLAPACAANLLTNGGFETGNTGGWTSWYGGWGSGYTATAQTTAKYSGNYGLRLQITDEASFGVYQTVTVTPGQAYQLNGIWKGTGGTGNWFEILLIDGTFSVSAADSAPGCFNHVITGYDTNGAFQYPAPASFGWQTFASTYNQEVSPYITNGTRVATGNKMTVVLKMGSYDNPVTPTAFIDNVTLEMVPEPGSLLALASGVGLLGLVRRRR